MIFELRGTNGWLRDRDEHAHRFKRLGSVTFLEKKHQSKHFCEGCETRLDSEIALKMHRGGGWCRGNFDVMSIEEQVKLRRDEGGFSNEERENGAKGGDGLSDDL